MRDFWASRPGRPREGRGGHILTGPIAMRMAAWEVVEFLVREKGLAPEKAPSLASIAVDFHVSEAVDLTQLVSGKIPKSLFLD